MVEGWSARWNCRNCPNHTCVLGVLPSIFNRGPRFYLCQRCVLSTLSWCWGIGGILACSARTAKQGAIDGALAGLVAFSMDSVATIVATLIIYWTGAFEQYMRQLAPQLEPEVLASANTLTLGLIVGSSCVSVLIGVLFSASGGWVFASVKPD